ncbi:MAG: right-handed parallel beta-helix repeat-containing protein [bacterium]|nr:right-handed parallel beta-helix repeat-containing protein [bacterium]
MRIKNITVFFTAAVIFLFFSISISSAQVIDAPPHMPGIIEGSGTHFEVTDSEYLNVSLDSSEYISARFESAPEMVVLDIKSSAVISSTQLKLSGLTPNTTYHKYQEDYQNHESFTTDENGVFYFDLDLNQNHTIFIQPRKSTQVISASDGGNCSNIGDWNGTTKTCTLNQDVNETIQINGGITLDGNGHTVSGSDTGSGVYVTGQNGIVKNITVTGFYYGIYLYNAKYAKVTDITANNNRYGVELDHAKYSIISNSTAADNKFFGLLVYYSLNNTISGSTFGPENSYGIQQAYTGDYNTYESNDISNNKNTGIITYGGGNYLTLRDNKIIANAYDGVVIGGDHHTLSGNIMSGNGFGGANGKSNFSIAGGYMDTNNIDQSNLIEGKPLYYLKNETNKIYDSSLDIGSFYCINCDNITLKGAALPEHAAKIFFWHTNNSAIEGTTSPDKNAVVYLWYSSNNTVKNSDLGRIDVRYYGSNNQIYSNNFSDPYTPVYTYNSTGNLFNLDHPTGGNFWKKNEAL